MKSLAVLAALALAGAAHAQEIRTLAPGAAPAASTLADMKGLVGNWAGPEGVAAFSAPLGGQIVGHLALNTDGKPRVEEIWVLRAEGGSVMVRQKHYTPDLKDREDKDRWGERRVVAVDAGHLFMENLTFATGKDSLDLIVRVPGAGGAAPTLLSWSMKRVK